MLAGQLAGLRSPPVPVDRHCIGYAKLDKSRQQPVDSWLVCGRYAAVLPSGCAAQRDGEVSRCLGPAKSVRSACDLSSKGQVYASCSSCSQSAFDKIILLQIVNSVIIILYIKYYAIIIYYYTHYIYIILGNGT